MKNFIYGAGTGLALSLLSIWGVISPETAYAALFGVVAGTMIADHIHTHGK